MCRLLTLWTAIDVTGRFRLLPTMCHARRSSLCDGVPEGVLSVRGQTVGVNYEPRRHVCRIYCVWASNFRFTFMQA